MRASKWRPENGRFGRETAPLQSGWPESRRPKPQNEPASELSAPNKIGAHHYQPSSNHGPEKKQNKMKQILRKPTSCKQDAYPTTTATVNRAREDEYGGPAARTTAARCERFIVATSAAKSRLHSSKGAETYFRLLMTIISLLILNLPNQFGAQTLADNNNNNVILKLSAVPVTTNATTIAAAARNADDDGAEQKQFGQRDSLERQQQEQQQALLGHRFKYHLNHLRPPSLVPITIQQADTSLPAATLSFIEPASPFSSSNNNSGPADGAQRSPGAQAGGQQQQVGERRQHKGASAASNARNRGQEGEQLVQLQLPLQLHLKLRPLPLPMPPPASKRALTSDESAANEAAQATNDDDPASGEKRKRSLEPPAQEAQEAAVTMRPIAHSHYAVTSAPQQRAPVDLLTLAWREAKRVLLLNTMSPALLQSGASRPDRRTADLTTGESAIDSARGPLEQYTSWPRPPAAETTPAPNLAPPQAETSATTDGPPIDTSMPIGQPADANQTTTTGAKTLGEVRRQRHSSQQLQGQPPQQQPQLPTTVEDARLQAMAAAMLPLVWPSFQLTASANRPSAPQSSGVLTASLGDLLLGGQAAATGGWPMKYTQLTRPGSRQQLVEVAINPAAASSDQQQQTPTSASDVVESTINLTAPIATAAASSLKSTPPPEVDPFKPHEPREEQTGKARAKRRKPIYLAAAGLGSSTPYPDSTRLANKYPMPKIKFRAADQQQQAQLASPVVGEQAHSGLVESVVAARVPLADDPSWRPPVVGEPHASNKKQRPLMAPNLPKSLSRLIEQQLLANATSLLLHHKSHNGGGRMGMPPTTSISKVVRLVKTNGTTAETLVHQQRQIVRSQQRAVEEVGHTAKLLPVSGANSSHMKRHSPNRTPTLIAESTSSASTITTTRPPVTSTSISVTTTTTTTTSRPPWTTRRWPAPRLSTLAPTPPPLPEVATAASAITTTTEVAKSITTTTTTTTRVSTTTTPAPARRRADQKRKPMNGGGGGRKRNSAALRNHVLEDEPPVGSDKVLPETNLLLDEHPVAAASGSNLTAADLARGGGASSRRLAQEARGIKLFHFKRKPDMNKLPFYKKPLNYTELGWTPEQILEHQEASRRAAEAAGESDETLANYLLSPAQTGERQKRQRRGKNHFERLMGELHGAAGSSGKQQSQDEDQGEPAESGEDNDALQLPANEVVQQQAEQQQQQQQDTRKKANSEERIPVMRKKAEPLVLRPMFSLMNQKRRVAPGSGPAAAGDTGAPPAALRSQPEVEAYPPPPLSQTTSGHDATGHNASRPIVRMRRKYHGELPSASRLALQMQIASAFDSGDQAPWRPSRPIWQPNVHAERVVLVPSGILTPSGSHVVPVLATSSEGGSSAADERTRLAMELLSWRPARQPLVSAAAAASTTSTQWRQPASADQVKSNDGLAPSGEESYLRAPSQQDSLAPTNQQLQQQQVPPETEKPQQQAMSVLQQHLQQQATSGSNELRVPKLLIKPMRPAKYSLNGYIPKPSLGQQQQQMQQQQVRAPAKSTAQWPPRTKRTGPTSATPLTNGKDLDSSTSNEVFSRRRGLQQQQRTAAAKPPPAQLNGLLNGGSKEGSSPVDKASPQHPAELSAHLKQLEENKRKYIVQPAKSPTLSAQKANLIKAKLGLIVTQSNSSVHHHHQRSTSADQPAVGERQPGHLLRQAAGDETPAIANTIVTFEAKDTAAKEHSHTDQIPLAGAAPLSAIPKTDFECTDKKGRFVAGLFADHKTGCQVWHLCSNNRKYSFLCPSGTIFSAKLRICDWKYNVRCENSSLPH